MVRYSTETFFFYPTRSLIALVTGLAVKIDKQPFAAEVNQRFLTYLVRDGQYVVLHLIMNFIKYFFTVTVVVTPFDLKLRSTILPLYPSTFL